MIEPTDEGVVIDVKAVPGAKRDAIAGPLGDALKVRVSAPPEGGKANKAICKLLAGRLGVATSAVAVIAGPTRPRKRIAVRGVSVDHARRLLLPA